MDVVFRHLDKCDRCRDLADSLDNAQDDVLDALRGGGGEDPLPDSCLRMMTQSEQLLNDSISSSQPKNVKPPPEMIRDYQLLEAIGEGGMGTLYRAEHTRLKRAVAIKLLAGAQVHGSAAVGRFMREMEAVGKLEHPNIVRKVAVVSRNKIQAAEDGKFFSPRDPVLVLERDNLPDVGLDRRKWKFVRSQNYIE